MKDARLALELERYIRMLARSSSRDPGTQDDLVQEALIVVVDLSMRYAGRPAEEVVLIAKTAIRNRMTDLARSRRKYEAHLDRIVPNDTVAASQETEAMVREAMDFVRSRLSETDQLVLDLTARGLSPANISAVTGRSKVSVWRSLSNIHSELWGRQG